MSRSRDEPVRLTKIYTRGGDKGETSRGDGKRVPKTDLRATLAGAYEVPPTQSVGSGYFEAVYRPSTKVLEYRLNLVGLSGPITMGYLHGPAGPGEGNLVGAGEYQR